MHNCCWGQPSQAIFPPSRLDQISRIRVMEKNRTWKNPFSTGNATTGRIGKKPYITSSPYTKGTLLLDLVSMVWISTWCPKTSKEASRTHSDIGTKSVWDSSFWLRQTRAIKISRWLAISMPNSMARTYTSRTAHEAIRPRKKGKALLCSFCSPLLVHLPNFLRWIR